MTNVETPDVPKLVHLLPRSDRKALAKAMRKPFHPIEYYAGAGKTVEIRYFQVPGATPMTLPLWRKEMSYKPVSPLFLEEVT